MHKLAHIKGNENENSTEITFSNVRLATISIYNALCVKSVGRQVRSYLSGV